MLACTKDDATGPKTGEAAIYRAAANGDHEAQVEMARTVLAKGFEGSVALSDATLLGMMWTSMAATSGRASHALAYAGAILVQGSQAIESGQPESDCEDLLAEALAIIDSVADAGHGRAELVAVALASHLSGETIAKAQAMRANINIEPLSADERLEDDAGLDWIAAVLGEGFVVGQPDCNDWRQAGRSVLFSCRKGSAMTNPANGMPMMTLAASGDREAIVMLRDALIAEGYAPALIPREELAIQAEVFARLAAEHGVVADKVYLAAILLLRSGECFRTGEDVRGEQFLQEAYGLFDEIIAADDTQGLMILVNAVSSLADDGDDLAACTLNRLVSVLTPEQAQQLSANVKNLKSQLEA